MAGTDKACKFIFSPVYVLGLVALVSMAALAAAFIAEGFLGLEPCRLCIYQRYPFALAILLGVTGILLRRKNGATLITLALCGLTFLANAGIAFYHTGVEQHWWRSLFEECAAPQIFRAKDLETLIQNIMSAPGARCDEIPWQDPILHLSMANYNVVLCLWLAIFCVTALVKAKAYSVSSVSQ